MFYQHILRVRFIIWASAIRCTCSPSRTREERAYNSGMCGLLQPKVYLSVYFNVFDLYDLITHRFVYDYYYSRLLFIIIV